jgi:Protein of unknown function (DUF3800)
MKGDFDHLLGPDQHIMADIQLMRVLYLDESGHHAGSPVAVVAGILLRNDEQWVSLSNRLEELRALVPDEFKEGFTFHATDLQNGGKYRGKWSAEDRWHLLDLLVATPREQKIDVAMGFCRPLDSTEIPKAEWSYWMHNFAYIWCISAANGFMNEKSRPDDFAMVIAEDRPEVRKTLKICHKMISDTNLIKEAYGELSAKIDTVTRIKYPPHFASKDDEAMLQLADVCAFALQRFIAGTNRYERLFESMMGRKFDATELTEFCKRPASGAVISGLAEMRATSVITPSRAYSLVANDLSG